MSKHDHTHENPRFESLTIEGFRSIKSVENLQLGNVNVLVGDNGAGKSNIIKFMEMLGWMFRVKNLQEFIFRNGGGDDQL